MSVTQQQLAYLNAMGIPVWVPRDVVDPAIFEIKLPETTLSEVAHQPSLQQQNIPQASVSIQIPTQHSPDYQQIPPLDILTQKIPSAIFSTQDLLNEIDHAVPLDSPKNITSIADSLKAKKTEQKLIDCSHLDWQSLHHAVTVCQQCELYNKRSQIVFGEGAKQATWMIIGDAPKEEEDTQGQPFMDRSGILLENMLTAIGLDRPSVYLANTLKCRPPNNRDPRQGESKACYGYIKRQIELVNPSLILIVGRIAAQRLLKTSKPLAQLRGRHHQISGLDIPVIVTYHPRYLLRQPRDKYKAWQDLKLAQSLLIEMVTSHN